MQRHLGRLPVPVRPPLPLGGAEGGHAVLAVQHRPVGQRLAAGAARLVRPVHHGQRLGVALFDVGRAVRLREHPHPGPHLPQLRSAAPVRAVPLVRQQLQRRHRDPGVPRAQMAKPRR